MYLIYFHPKNERIKKRTGLLMTPVSQPVLKGLNTGNKTDVDICRVEKNTSDHCKKNGLDYLLGYDRLYEHHTYGSNEDPPGSTTSATCG
jgi:hypothetical protein